MLIIAHRGDSRMMPENTLPAFASAVAAGANLVELDYRHSADGVPVVIHDEFLDRTTNAQAVFGRSKLAVAACSLEELKRLDAGSWFGPKFAGTPLATLEEALDAIHAGSRVLIEQKAGDAKTLVDLLNHKGLLDKAIVQSFDWQFVTECHRLAPRLSLAALGKSLLTAARLDEIARTGARIVAWKQERLGRREIAAVHRRGWQCFAYTVNDARRARQLVEWGLDGLITDLPAEMMRELPR